MPTSARTFSWQLSLRYVVALSIVAALSGAAHLAFGTVIRTEASRAKEINVSGRQRMLSQRIALHGRLLGDPLGERRRRAVRRELAADLALMRRSHEGLLHGDPDMVLPGVSTARLRSVYFEPPQLVDGRTRAFLRAGDAVLRRSAAPVRRDDPDPVAALEAARGPLLPSLDSAVTALQRESAADVRRLEHASALVLGVTLAVLLLEALFVFRPLVRQVRRRTERLAAAEGRLRAVVENALVGVVTLDAAGVVRSANATAATLFRCTPGDLRGRAAVGLLAPGAGEMLSALISAALAGRALPASELAALRADGGAFTAEVAVTAARTPGDVTLVMLVTDVTERRTHEAELAHRAVHDTLTGLPNRVLLLDRLAQAQARLWRNGGRLGLLFIDLDRFKVVNDSLGHKAGDHLLQAVAHRLQQVLRGADTLARFGGDEFLLLCDGAVSEVDALALAHRILAALELPVELPGGDTASVGASIGIALSAAGEGHSPETVIQNADIAMYTAKRRGGGGAVVFESSSRRRSRPPLDQENAPPRTDPAGRGDQSADARA